MSDRNVDDLAVYRVIGGPTLEGQIRIATKTWSVADFDFAIEHATETTTPSDQKRWIEILPKLRSERAINEMHSLAEAANEKRYEKSEDGAARRHRELLRPHWVVWATFAAACAGALIALAAWLFPRSPRP